jgi:hypothetical protein
MIKPLLTLCLLLQNMVYCMETEHTINQVVEVKDLDDYAWAKGKVVSTVPLQVALESGDPASKMWSRIEAIEKEEKVWTSEIAEGELVYHSNFDAMQNRIQKNRQH